MLDHQPHLLVLLQWVAVTLPQLPPYEPVSLAQLPVIILSVELTWRTVTSLTQNMGLYSVNYICMMFKFNLT